jgi:tetratricopeptide (TPR) repeat protein
VPLARRYRLDDRLDDAMQLLDRVAERTPEWLAERGLLHLARKELVLAERAFAEAAAAVEAPAGVMVNLMFTRLALGRVPEAIAVLPQAKRAAADPRRRRTLELFRALSLGGAPLVDTWSAEDEKLFAEFIQQIGRLESVEAIIEMWSKARPASATVRRLQAELAPLRAKRLIDQGDAAGVLRRYGSLAAVAPPVLRNLLGIAAALRQDFAGARKHFAAALARPDDARVHQNLAIVCEWSGDTEAAVEHWRQFLATHAAQMGKPPGIPHYRRRIAALAEERLRRLQEAAEGPTHD